MQRPAAPFAIATAPRTNQSPLFEHATTPKITAPASRTIASLPATAQKHRRHCRPAYLRDELGDSIPFLLPRAERGDQAMQSLLRGYPPSAAGSGDGPNWAAFKPARATGAAAHRDRARRPFC